MKDKKAFGDMLLDSLAGIGRKKKKGGAPEPRQNPAGETGEQGEGSIEDLNIAAGDAGSPPRPKRKLSEKQKIGIELRRLIQKILIVAAVVVTLLTFVGGVHIWHDNNMFPNVKDGDLVITFKLGGCYNGDIVLYKIDGETRMGRVVGIPGDTIDIGDDGTYTINGTVPYETIYFATKPAAGSTVRYPYTVREGEVFIFNDMRDMTYDSRVYGGIAETKGKVVLIIRRRGF
ncbi:MAG: signal peptidase I [Mogibacterium sp.]|nr:signal peptidase I [Mogibacterium sp.]